MIELLGRAPRKTFAVMSPLTQPKKRVLYTWPFRCDTGRELSFEKYVHLTSAVNDLVAGGKALVYPWTAWSIGWVVEVY